MKKSTILIEQACFSLYEFKQVYEKMQRRVALLGKSESTLSNYARCLASMALYFNCNPLDLDREQVLDYLYLIKNHSRTPSESYFKHTVYELRFANRSMGMQKKHVLLPKMKLLLIQPSETS